MLTIIKREVIAIIPKHISCISKEDNFSPHYFTLIQHAARHVVGAVRLAACTSRCLPGCYQTSNVYTESSRVLQSAPNSRFIGHLHCQI
jgi:hypothetical protein